LPLLVLTLIALSSRPAAGANPIPTPPLSAGEECTPTLDRLEAALRADPDSLGKGSDYRHAVIPCGAYDRALAFFAELGAAHPRSAHLQLNYGYAYVDKIPAAGAITRVILANKAIERFTAAVTLEPGWLALYTRGNSYLFWPTVFGRTPHAVADLEKAVALGDAAGNRPVHVRAWIALGDGLWKLDRLEPARAVWQEGVRRFPVDPRLAARLASTGDALAAIVTADLDPDKRVDTDLSPLAEPAPR
jgi:tetratricopeptide (TPR) repeat protein